MEMMPNMEQFKEGVFKLTNEEQEEYDRLKKGKMLSALQKKRIKEIEDKIEKLKGATTTKVVKEVIETLEKRREKRE